MNIPRIRAVMTEVPQTINEDQLLSDARQIMKTKRIRHLPVMRGDELVGVISDRDINLVVALSVHLDNTEGLKVSDASVEYPYTVEPDEPLDSVLAEMYEPRIGSALISENGKLIGIFTTVDACREFTEFLRKG